jgi:hypothetical protein
MASKQVASAYVDLQLQTAQFKAAIGEAQGSMRQFSAQMRAETQKSRESVRLLSEELGLGIPRGLQNIISKLPGVTTAMNAAFAGVVVFALGKVLIDVTEKVAKFIKTAETAGTVFASEMHKVTTSTLEENDKLALSIEMMKAHLAEIEKKPVTNGAAIALAEARVQADELAKSLATDMEQISKLFQEKGLGNISAFLTGQTDTDDTKKQVQAHIDAINAVDYNEQDKLSKLSPTDAAGRKKVLDDAQVERLKAIKAAVDDVTSSYNKLHDQSVADQTLQDREGLGSIQGHDPHQSDAAMAILGTTGHQFQVMYNQRVLRGQASALSAQVEGADAHAKGVEQAKAADEAFLKDRQDFLKNLEATHALSLQQEKMFWDAMARIPGLSAGSRALMNRQGTDVQAEITKQNSTNSNNDRFAFIRDSFDEQRKQIEGSTPQGPNELFESMSKADNESTEAYKKAARDAYDGTAEDLKQKEKLAELLIKIEEANGRLSKSQAAQQLQALHAKTDAATAQAFSDANQAGAGYDLKQGAQLQGEAITRSVNDAQNVAQYSFSNKMTSDLNDWIEKSTDLGNIMGNLFTESINQVNDAIIKLLTTKNDPHPFRAAGHAIFTDVAKQGLQSSEGGIMKALGLGAKDVQKVYVVNQPHGDGTGGSAAGGMLHSGILGALNNSNWAGGLFGGKLFGPGGFFDPAKTGTGPIPTGGTGAPLSRDLINSDKAPASSIPGIINQIGQMGAKFGTAAYAGSNTPGQAPVTLSGGSMPMPSGNDGLDTTGLPGFAGGGLLSANTWATVGERGPEVISLGQTSRIYNARDTAAMMSGGGNTTHNHSWQVDARGATDPAAIHAAVNRSMKQALPQFVAASHASSNDHKARRPTNAR